MQVPCFGLISRHRGQTMKSNKYPWNSNQQTQKRIVIMNFLHHFYFYLCSFCFSSLFLLSIMPCLYFSFVFDSTAHIRIIERFGNDIMEGARRL
ncbi:hypothetical protein BDW69DRAFT_162857 [Aspergillus filifer]